MEQHTQPRRGIVVEVTQEQRDEDERQITVAFAELEEQRIEELEDDNA